MPSLLEEPSPPPNDTLPPSTHAQAQAQAAAKGLPKGVVLDKDGKPCRTCTSSAAWMAMMKGSSSSSSRRSTSTSTSTSSSSSSSSLSSSSSSYATSQTSQPTLPDDCPADTEALGRSTWTFLHTLTATYPSAATSAHQSKTSTFLRLFAQLYPCWVCAEDFQTWIDLDENKPEKFVRTREDFGRWMCRAHNEVNRKLGKPEFDCDFWAERWRDGWKDGRCG